MTRALPDGSSCLDLARVIGASLHLAVVAKMFVHRSLETRFLKLGEEHVGSLAWLCRMVQASGRFSAPGGVSS